MDRGERPNWFENTKFPLNISVFWDKGRNDINRICCPICGTDNLLICNNYINQSFNMFNHSLPDDYDGKGVYKPPPVCNHLLFIQSHEGTRYVSKLFAHFLNSIGIKQELAWFPEGMIWSTYIDSEEKSPDFIEVITENSKDLGSLNKMSIYFSSMLGSTWINSKEHPRWDYDAWAWYGFINPRGE